MGSVQAERIEDLQPDTELRFEVAKDSDEVTLELLSGKAEIFGTELVTKKEYTFLADAKVAVFTWYGCRLKLAGAPQCVYVAKETPMVMYLNTHGCLERLRRNADIEHKKSKSDSEGSPYRGPVCMVVGPGDVGKSTLTKILLNYAIRFGRRPIFVDLDVGQGSISIPGTIGAVLVERIASIREGFSMEAPLVYQLGHVSPSSNLTLYNVLIKQLSSAVHAKMDSNKKVSASGVIVNTCGWVEGAGYSAITHCAQAFEVDLIVVLDQEKLYNILQQDIPFIKVLHLPKSGGVVARTRATRIRSRDERMTQYFYGLHTKLHPHTFDVSFSKFKVYQIGGLSKMSSLRPLDDDNDRGEDLSTKPREVAFSARMKSHIVALSRAEEVSKLLTSNVMGFICIVDVDMEKETIRVLCPQPKPLPTAFGVMSTLQFSEPS